MVDDAINKTTKCNSHFKCLDGTSGHPRCTVDHRSEENRIVVSTAAAATCPYRMRFGGGYACDCPTHAALISPEHPRVFDDLGSDRPDFPPRQQVDAARALPQSVDAAVAILVEELPMKDKAAIANMPTDEVGEMTLDIGTYIRTSLGLEAGNEALMRSCAAAAGCAIDDPDDAAAVILSRLVRTLVKTHRLSAI